MTTAELITIGDEILIGRTVDTNSAWLGDRLHRIGLPVRRITSISDNPQAICQALDWAFAQSDVVIMTGGLGATQDDLTRRTLADYFHSELTVHEPTLQKVKAFFEMRGKTLSATNATVANIPACAVALHNQVGAAPGMRFDLPDGKVLFSLPGVPFEMKHLTEAYVLPYLEQNFQQNAVRFQTLRTVGLPESSMAERIADIENALPPEIKLAYNPSVSSLDLRLVLVCPREKAEHFSALFDQTLSALKNKIGEHLYAEGEETLQEVVGKLLLQKQMIVATAESCTGGSLCGRILSIAGASRYCNGGIVAYANQTKSQLLGVKNETLEIYGAVSEQTALEMAVAARVRLAADVAIATTGIAGPDGGRPDKPVGTVWIAYADAHRAFAHKMNFDANRERNIERTITAALNILRLELLKL